jgi:hypothetical protein
VGAEDMGPGVQFGAVHAAQRQVLDPGDATALVEFRRAGRSRTRPRWTGSPRPTTRGSSWPPGNPCRWSPCAVPPERRFRRGGVMNPGAILGRGGFVAGYSSSVADHSLAGQHVLQRVGGKFHVAPLSPNDRVRSKTSSDLGLAAERTLIWHGQGVR